MQRSFYCIFFIIFTPSSQGDPKDDKSSLVFVFDTTGSMHNDLKQLIEGAEMILSTALEHSNVISNFVFVPYNDPAVGPPTVTKDKEVFKSALNEVRVRGGGDCPEKALSGIIMALNVSLPGSFIYVLTDATAGDHRMIQDVLDVVQRKQSQVVFVLTGHCNDLDRPHYKVYQRIAAASFGQVFNLNKTSVHNVLDFVRSSITGKAVNLGSAVNPPGYNYSKSIPVDSTLEEVTVSVSGAKPKIQITDPKGEDVSGPPKLITTLDLSEVMVVKVLQPEPGNWTITVGSEDSYSVKVAGLSNLTFQHGFSIHRPAVITETSLRPLQGAYNYMMIQLTELDRPISVNYAEVLDLEGKTLFEIPLQQTDEKTAYLAQAFLPPDDLFFIAINGRDEYGQEFRRVGATTVQAKTPEIPFLTVTEEIKARPHETIRLTCQIESLVPVTAVWTKDGKRVQPKVSSLQSTVIEYMIEGLDEASSGTYRCTAENNAGISKAYTQVTLIAEPPQVTLLPESKTISAGDNITLSCTAFSEIFLRSLKLLHNGTLVERSDIDPAFDNYYSLNLSMIVDENSSGLYTCEAENKGGKSSKSVVLNVLTYPTAEILEPKTNNSNVKELLCVTTNAKYTIWLAPNGTVALRDEMTNNNQSFLVFPELTISDDGVWTCVAIRNDLEARDSIIVNVTIKPEVSIECNDTLTLQYGVDYNLICNALAKPKPDIFTWHLDNGVIFNSTINESQPFSFTTNLLLSNVTATTEGTYYCYAENSQGFMRDSITVKVRKNMTVVQAFTDQTVDLYSRVKLDCIIDSYPLPFIKWYHNGTDLKISDNIHIATDNTSVVLSRVDFHHLGIYMCVAENEYEMVAINGSLSVIDLASPVLSKEPVKIVTRKGKSTIVTCRLFQGRPAPRISWLHKPDGSDVFQNIPDDIAARHDTTELLITNVDIKHAGQYRCIAENAVGRDVYETVLVVQYPPQLNIDSMNERNETLELRAGEGITLSCHVIGLPPPLVVWTKDNKPVTYTKNIYLTGDNDLTIENATEYDSGLFICTATSFLGSVQRNFSLFVFVSPSIPIPDNSVSEVLEGEMIELPCVAQGVPSPRLYWRRGDSPLLPTRQLGDDHVLRFVANLTDFGEYTCVATNKYGNASQSFYVYVWVPPYIEPPLQTTMQVKSGENAILRCDAVGFPVPVFLWEFQHTLLVENTTELSFNDYGLLYINNASSQHDGTYTCIAENYVGTERKTINVHVFEQPVILPDEFTGPYIATTLDVELILACKATGKPKPFIVWIKNGRYIQKHEHYEVNHLGSLRITALNEELSGFYTCVAKNSMGQANRTVEVQIYPSPKSSQSNVQRVTITLVEGTNSSVECPLRSAHSFTVKWYKNSNLVSEGLLHFPNVSRDNASNYACTVITAVSRSHADLTILVQWPPTFINNVNYTALVVQHDDYTFDCVADASPVAKMKWLFNSKLVLGAEDARLKLMNIKLSSSGVYKCVVSNDHGTIEREFTLNVLEPPFISEFDTLDVHLKVGSSADLDCIAKGTPSPDIVWTFENPTWHLLNGSLHTNDTSVHSEGSFRCDALNTAGKAHLIYRVFVFVTPAVSEIVLFDGSNGATVSGTVEVLQGSKSRIACYATGNPKPYVQWIRNGNTIANNSLDLSYADLVLNGVVKRHAGLYTCMASSDSGIDEKIIKVDVLEPPEIFTSLLQDSHSENSKNLEVLSGQTFYLHCHPSGNPVPQLYWFKNNAPLKLYNDKMVTIDFGEIVVSNNALEEHSGNYTCVARNRIGEAAFSYVVDVLAPPPKPKEIAIKIKIRQNKHLNLTCPVQGNPLPSVVWVKQPYTELSELLSERIKLSTNNYTLTINNTESIDSGKYSCLMTNKVGVTEIVYSVQVLRPPSIGDFDELTTNTTVLGANIGRSVALNCEADGEPKPKVTWFKNAQPLSPGVDNIQTALDDNILTIWRISTRDAAQYICVAENEAGIAHRRFNVFVSVPGKYTSWSSWSVCSVTCGPGHQRRTRTCRYLGDLDSDLQRGHVVLDRTSCVGAHSERRKCQMPPCEDPEESGPRWSAWSKWSECSVTCGSGTQTRTRYCTTNNYHCYGDNMQIKKCSHLPRCGAQEWSNEVLYSKEEITESNPYIPEATFEIQPFSSNYPDVEEFDVHSEIEPLNMFDITKSLSSQSSKSTRCKTGFKFNYTMGQCEDIDECLLEYNSCHSTQRCYNTVGSYHCECPAGFSASATATRCLDINECALGVSLCEYACVNTAGAYVCACPPSRRLHEDRLHCVMPHESSYRKSSEDEEGEYIGLSINNVPERFNKKSRQ